jgi:hypothetical protein
MKIKAVQLAVLLATLAAPVLAAEGPVPKGVPHLDHIFLIMMENHGFAQIVNNPNAPFANRLARSSNRATNYFAIGHPSLTNYLEVVGGSNFGVRSDNNPDWHDQNCTPISFPENRTWMGLFPAGRCARSPAPARTPEHLDWTQPMSARTLHSHALRV